MSIPGFPNGKFCLKCAVGWVILAWIAWHIYLWARRSAGV
jgi:hypothetical protein